MIFNLKQSNIRKFFHQKSPIPLPNDEIVNYINSICKDDKICEKYYFNKLQNIKINLDNIKNIPIPVVKEKIPEQYKQIINQIKSIGGKNSLEFENWAIKQIKNIKPEDYLKLTEDLKLYKSLLDKDPDFKPRNINEIADEKQLFEIIKPFYTKKITQIKNEWKGQWIYKDNKVTIFESNDPNTISNISTVYNTRWCIKNPEIAKTTYQCEKNPMQFVFLNDLIVCVIHLYSKQIKDVNDYALNDYSIIKEIDDVLEKNKLTTTGGDFTKYFDTLNNTKTITNAIENSENKYELISKLIQGDIDNLLYINKNYIIYDPKIKELTIKKLEEAFTHNSWDGWGELGDPINLSSDIIKQVPEIRKLYIDHWSKKILNDITFYAYCPGYLTQYSEIQNSLKKSINSTIDEFTSKDETQQEFLMNLLIDNPQLIPQNKKEKLKENKDIFFTSKFISNFDQFINNTKYRNDPEIIDIAKKTAYDKVDMYFTEYLDKYKIISYIEDIIDIDNVFNNEITNNQEFMNKYTDKLIKSVKPTILSIVFNENIIKDQSQNPINLIFTNILHNKYDNEKEKILNELYEQGKDQIVSWVGMGDIATFNKLDMFFNGKLSENKKEFYDKGYVIARNRAKQLLSEGNLNEFNRLDSKFDGKLYKDIANLLNESYPDARKNAIQFYIHSPASFTHINTIYHNVFDKEIDSIINETYPRAIQLAIEALRNQNYYRFETLNQRYQNKIINTPEIYDYAKKTIQHNLQRTWQYNNRPIMFEELNKIFDNKFSKDPDLIKEFGEKLPNIFNQQKISWYSNYKIISAIKRQLS